MKYPRILLSSIKVNHRQMNVNSLVTKPGSNRTPRNQQPTNHGTRNQMSASLRWTVAGLSGKSKVNLYKGRKNTQGIQLAGRQSVPFKTPWI